MKRATNLPAAPANPADQAYVGHPKARRRSWLAGILAPLLVMALSATAVDTAAAQVLPSYKGAKQCTAVDASAIVPSDGTTLLGANLDWASETLAEHAKKLGRTPAVAVQFSDIPYDTQTWTKTTQAAEQIRAAGGTMLLTLEPYGGLETMTPQVIEQLAADLRAINDTGVPVVVRFAHEMNGSWYPWAQQPSRYIKVFREVATAIHENAPGSSMMWAPNYGGGYPFPGGPHQAKPGSQDYKALDTNADGKLTMADDSYAPYYPGEQYVDWVGVSLYHWGNKYPWGSNDLPEPGKFAGMLTGTYNGRAGDDTAVPNFYQVYGVQHGHPVAVPETAALYTPSEQGSAELDIKRAWWGQVFSDRTHERFPQLKMINWFEWHKYESEIDADIDWRASGSPEIAEAFRADLPSWLDSGQAAGNCK